MHNYDQYPELGTIRKFEKKAISDVLAITLLHVLLQPRHPSSRPSGVPLSLALSAAGLPP